MHKINELVCAIKQGLFVTNSTAAMFHSFDWVSAAMPCVSFCRTLRR